MADKNIQITISAKDEASQVLNKIGGNVSVFNDQMQKVGIAFAAVGAATGLAAKSFVSAASEMEQQRVAFETLTGNAEVGKRTLEDLINFAKSTPFEIPGILEQSKRLLAMGTTSENLIPTFEMLGNVAAGVGMEKMPQLVLAFGQIQAKGRLMGTELRQLTEAGFNLADSMGISNAQLEEMVSNGQVSFDMVKQGFIDATAEGGRFHDMMKEQSKTTGGQLSNLSDSMFKLRASMGEALLPAVNSLVQALLPLALQLGEFAKNNPIIVQGLVAFGLALGVIGALILTIMPIITAFALGMGAIVAPILLVGVAIAGLITVGFLLMTHWEQVQAFAIQIWGTISAFLASVWEKIKTVFNVAMTFILALAQKYFTLMFGTIQEKMTIINEIITTILKAIDSAFGTNLSSAWATVRSIGEKIMGVFNSIRDSIQGVINKLGELAGKVGEGIGSIRGKLGFQHGGVVPGSFNQPVPAVLHGGERVVSRTGVDVNQPQGSGSGGGVNIIIEGDVNSIETLDKIVEAVKNAIGRDNELAQLGVAI